MIEQQTLFTENHLNADSDSCQVDLLVRRILPDKLILDACCGGRMFWYEKENENTVFADKRKIEKGAFANNWNPNWCVQPDIIYDFREMPFKDKTFKLIIYDPPHLTSGSEKSVINKKYGLLNKWTWKEDIVNGFKECWRVLDDYGTLIFKWNEANINSGELVRAFPVKPLFGDFTGKTGKTIWMTFMKIPENARQNSA